jgi:hypothetical protein
MDIITWMQDHNTLQIAGMYGVLIIGIKYTIADMRQDRQRDKENDK